MWPALVRSQHPATLTVAVQVVDSVGSPVAAADVAIVRGVAETIAHALTDASGRAVLTIERATGSRELLVRKIGFRRGYRFFSLPTSDSITLDVRLSRTIVALAPVTVSAAEDMKRKSYHLSAEDIENSKRPIIDGTDIFKLRPDMMTSRGGAGACSVAYTPRDGWIESVWVDGKRVTLARVDPEFVRGRKIALGIAGGTSAAVQARRPGAGRAVMTYRHIDSVLSILGSIKPEHIEEITYHDCFDVSVGMNHSDMAMYIVLKPGIGFLNGTGSYVLVDTGSSMTQTSVAQTLPRFRFRVLGVFDIESGDPVPDVDVIDSATGTRAKTTATGTVSLFFVPEGTATLRFHRDGYRDTTLTLVISPTDTLPVTFVLSRQRPPSATGNNSASVNAAIAPRVSARRPRVHSR